MARTIDTAIAAVTVLSDRAVVTRTGKFSVTAEDQHWVVTPLPLTVATDSIRVKGRGDINVKFLAIATETIVTVESRDQKIAALDQQILEKNTEVKTLGDRIQTLELQQNFVGNLSEEAVERFAKSLATERISLDQTNSFLDFVGNQHQTFSRQIQILNEQIRQLNLEITALEQQKSLLKQPKKNHHYSLSITVEVAGDGEFELEINYQVTQASWSPRYDIAVDTEQKVLTLDYLADVVQSTGEDWHNADLTISTAQVSQGIIPPQLKPWYLDLQDFDLAMAIPAGAAPSPKRNAVKKRNFSSLNDGSLEQEKESFEATSISSTVKKQGSTVTFYVGIGGDIPSDHNPHQVTLFHAEYPIKLNYLALPQKVSFAYLRAIFTNPTDGVTLLPGVTNLFRDGAFVGKDNLKNISPGQDVTLNLGIDEGLQIERKLGDRQVDKTLLSKLRRLTYGYEIKIKNLQTQTHSLTIQEQIPVGRHEKIKINLQQITPKIEPTKLGILEWKTEISAETEQTFSYQFTVEHPPNFKIMGLIE